MIKYIAILTTVYVSAFWGIVFLGYKVRKNRARYFLGLFMTASFLLYFGHALFFSEYFAVYFYYDVIYTITSLLVYPLYYQYIRLLTVDLTWNSRYLIHYIPSVVIGVLLLIFNLLNYSLIHADLNAFYLHKINALVLPEYPILLNKLVFILSRMVFAFQVILYLFLGVRLIRLHQTRILNFYSNIENKQLLWVKILNISLVITSIFSLVFNVIGKSVFINNHFLLLIPAVLFSTMLFLIGFLGNSQDQIVKDIQDEFKEEETFVESVQLPDHELDEKLRYLFNIKKIHLNPELKIWEVSKILSTNRTYISNFINKNYKLNFSRYVNQYRVLEAKAMLENPEQMKYSLETIGEACGFGSLNNFIRVFREFEQITPGRFRDQVSGRNSGTS